MTYLFGTGSTAKPTARPEPLGKDQIDSLVRDSIKSTDPVERRRAFDRVLQEIQSPTFTANQAITIIRAMAQNGASGEQW
jgi:hypothetical protein